MKRKTLYQIGIITGWFVMLLCLLYTSLSLILDEDEGGWLDITLMIVGCLSWSILTEPIITFVENLNRPTVVLTPVKDTLLGKEVTVFDYELYENIGDLKDGNEFYWKKGTIIQLNKQPSGDYLVNVKTEDGKIVEDVGTNYLRGL